MLHLLQFSYHVCPMPVNHQDCIRTMRQQLATVLEHSPPLTSLLQKELDRIYQTGVQKYLHDLQIGQYLPATCPFTLAQLLDHDFLLA